MQQELFWRSVVEVAYIGSATRKIGVNRAGQQPVGVTRSRSATPTSTPWCPIPSSASFPMAAPATPRRRFSGKELLRPYPQFANITERLVPIGTLDYQAIQVTWDKRLTNGVQFQINYTGSRNLEATSVLNMGEGVFREVSNTHRPHMLRFTGGWTLSDFESRGKLMRYVLGGWQINASTFLRSGLTTGMPDNVDLIGDPVLENPTKARWFNTCTLTVAGARQGCADASEQPAFRIRPNNALDTTGARLEGVFVSDPLILDMSFFKTFRFSQRISFQTRVEAFNLTNAVQWPGPNTTVTATAFGTVAETQSNDPRFVQIAFRLLW